MTQQDLFAAYQASGGVLKDAELQAAGNQAWSYLCQQTMDRIYCYGARTEPVERCFCELVDTIHRQQTQGVVSSETVGQWSRSYVNLSEGQNSTQIYTGIINRWLGGTGLLYRGWP